MSKCTSVSVTLYAYNNCLIFFKSSSPTLKKYEKIINKIYIAELKLGDFNLSEVSKIAEIG